MNTYRKNLGKILKQQRHSSRLTLHQLSDYSGVSPSHLGRIENGKRFPSADILQRIARPLGFSEEELFTLAGYLTPRVSVEQEKEAVVLRKDLDNYVARVLFKNPWM